MITTNSFKLVGIEPVRTIIETECSRGIGIHLVGLADQNVKESLLRTVTAMQALDYHIPGNSITINIAPADLHKSGTGFDLPIALTIIAESAQETLPDINKYLIAGELGLDASVRAVTGTVQAVELAKSMGLKGCIIPRSNAREAEKIADDTMPVYAVDHLKQAIDILKGTEIKDQYNIYLNPVNDNSMPNKKLEPLNYISGLNAAGLRAIEIAAAGGHNVIMVGDHGSGRATLAKALREILPPMTREETLQVMRTYSAAGKNYDTESTGRPFRAPHCSCSMVTLFGGGAGDNIRPGEITLADNGILYIDDFVDLPKSVGEALRAPLEDKHIVISRLKSKTVMPARLQLVLASTPCPCGHYGSSEKTCTCTTAQRTAWLSRLSGPVIDRVDLQVFTHEHKTGVPLINVNGEELREKVIGARRMQAERYGTTSKTNKDMNMQDIEQFCKLSDDVADLIEKLIDRLGLSARAYTRILKIARTIADLEERKDIRPADVAEAASFRFLDRRNILETEPSKTNKNDA